MRQNRFLGSEKHHLLRRILRIPNIVIKLAMRIMAHSPKVGIGAGITYVNNVLVAFVPPAVVTKTLAVPAVPEAVVQVADVAETTLKLVQAVPPTVIPVIPVKPVPVIVIAVPPSVGPELGLTDVTVGSGVPPQTPPAPATTAKVVIGPQGEVTDMLHVASCSNVKTALLELGP